MPPESTGASAGLCDPDRGPLPTSILKHTVVKALSIGYSALMTRWATLQPMKPGAAVMSAAAAATIIATATIGTPTAFADTKSTKFGTWERLRDANGAVITAWNIYEFEHSDDTIPGYPLAGTLWEASAAVMPIRGTVTPIIPNLNARTDSGQNYQVLWQAYAPNGISGETLNQGDKSKGEIYFDVTGAPPRSVVYNNGVEDLIVWAK